MVFRKSHNLKMDANQDEYLQYSPQITKLKAHSQI